MTEHHHHGHPQYLVRDRQEGKTTLLLDWVKMGEPVESMIGWSRVVIVRSIAIKREMMHRFGLDHRQVVSRQEIGQMRSGYDLSRTEFAIDDAEDLILDTFPHPDIWRNTRLITITGADDLMELATLKWALEHTDSEVHARLAELQRGLASVTPDPSLIDAEGHVTAHQYPAGLSIVAPRVPTAEASKRPSKKTTSGKPEKKT